MKQTSSKLFYIGLIATTIVSCSAPNVANKQQLKAVPTTVDNDTIQGENVFESLSLKSYFEDPHLVNLFNKAVVANPDYQITQQRIQIANAFLTKAKLSNLPSLEIGASASGTHYGKYTMDGVGNYDTNLSQNITEQQKINRDFTPNYWLGAQTSWEIFAWGKVRNQKLAAKKRYFATTEGIKLTQTLIFTNIANLYYQLVALDKKLNIYEENYKIQERAHEIITAQRVAGKANELAVQQFNAQGNNLLAEIERIRIEVISVEKALSSLIGEYNGTIERGTKLSTNYLEILNQNIPAETVIHNRPDVAESFYNFEASQADSKAARAAFFPKIEISASIGQNSFNTETFFKPASLATNLLGNLMMPVFNKGQIRYQFKVAKADQEIAFLNYQKSVTNAYNELSELLKHIEIYDKVLNLKKEEVTYLQRAVGVANDLYLTGYANYLEIINSQKNQLQSQLDLVEIQLKNTQTNILLFKALGGSVN
ncbi:TolC family protein [Flavobacterium agricola]|uniref:TolC family protein n=1 Tax=Flavobacterium agricola TaxID=2870839 RepID=A0ABY6M1G6_9FLAO|nr:TolC family protein [Flavobacterium agricola]UYW02354.1 TolC family protein [Flavobacterium agricola]